ncbi:MAG: rhodanese-like domain-containing protein [Chthoniobacterales bacterium]|nr:rhodanese-like domain-containing protein [Chthoniobacterales bacterium]
MDYPSSSPRLSVTIEWRLLLGVALLLLLSFGLVSCRGVDWFLLKRSLHGKFNDISWITTEQLANRLVDKDRLPPVLLDVRTPVEFEVSHLKGARQVDPKAEAQSAAKGLPKDAPIVTYCSVGYRSGEMAERLRAAGYTRVQNLEGSIFQWANERRPLVRGEGERVTRVHPHSAVWGRLLAPEVRAPVSP